MHSERKWAAALAALILTAAWATATTLSSRARPAARASSSSAKTALLEKPVIAFPYIAGSGLGLDPEERDAEARARYAAAYSKLTLGDEAAAFEGTGVKAEKTPASFWRADAEADESSRSAAGETPVSGPAGAAEEGGIPARTPAVSAEGWIARADLHDSLGQSFPERTGESADGADEAEAGRTRGAALLEKLGVRSGELSGFEGQSKRSAGGVGSGGLLRTAGAPSTGLGKEQAQTLYINSTTADLYMDPSATESAPEGFSEKDRKRAEVVYKLFGETKSISLAKGSDLMRGEQVTWSGTQSEDGKWLQVEAGGVSAWVKREDLTGSSWSNWNPATAKAFEIGKIEKGRGLLQVAKEAERHVGDRYVWGASSPGQFDCSGLVHYAYRRYGMQLPRVSRDQKAAAQMISPEQLEPGDLVFTGNPVRHVMMYIGDGRLVEAMNRKNGVVYSSLARRTSGGKPVYYGTFRHLQSKK